MGWSTSKILNKILSLTGSKYMHTYTLQRILISANI